MKNKPTVIEKEKYSHDAPSLIWKIYELIEKDKLFEAEDLVYKTFNEVREEVVRKTKIRFEILQGRMEACEKDHPDTHKVSLKEIPSWIGEINHIHKVHLENETLYFIDQNKFKFKPKQYDQSNKQNTK